MNFLRLLYCVPLLHLFPLGWLRYITKGSHSSSVKFPLIPSARSFPFLWRDVAVNTISCCLYMQNKNFKRRVVCLEIIVGVSTRVRAYWACSLSGPEGWNIHPRKIKIVKYRGEFYIINTGRIYLTSLCF